MAKLKADLQEPGMYAFVCDCGYKRRVADSERNFSCERPVSQKEPRCRIVHKMDVLLAPKPPQAKVIPFAVEVERTDVATATSTSTSVDMRATPLPESKKETKKLTRKTEKREKKKGK